MHSSSSFIFVSDTHVGNRFGICTPEPELGDDINDIYRPESIQLKLYEGFRKCADRIKQPNKIRALFCGGDMVDGVNPKRPGHNLWTNDPLVAVYDFNKLMKPLTDKAELTFLVRGSDYHVAQDRTTINYDELAAQMIGAKPYGTKLYGASRQALFERVRELRKKGATTKQLTEKLGDLEKESLLFSKPDKKLANKLKQDTSNIFARDNESRLKYPVSDVRFKGIFHNVAFMVKHHVSFSPNYQYRGTGLTRNDFIQSTQKERHFPNGYHKIVHAYGHAHYFHLSGNDTHYNFVIPCFKANDTYLKQYGVTEPDYGIVEVIVEPNEDIIVFPYTLRGEDYPVTDPYDLAS